MTQQSLFHPFDANKPLRRLHTPPFLVRLRMGVTERTDKIDPSTRGEDEREEEDDENIDISSLTDHQAQGALLGDFVAGWLNMSNGAHDIHALLGDAVCVHYRALREAGWNELGAVALEIGERLQSSFDFPEDDDSLCPWDIAYCIYDAVRSQVGTGMMPRPPRRIVERADNVVVQNSTNSLVIRKDFMEEVIDNYRSMIDRYKLLREFLEGGCSITHSLCMFTYCHDFIYTCF